MELPPQFNGKVKKSTSGCWHWTEAIGRDGYGHYTRRKDGKTATSTAHRFVYEYVHGPLPRRGEPGHLQVDHECHNRSKSCKGGPTCLHRRCVNPAHLVAKPAKDNSHASAHTAASKNRAMTECAKGHLLSGDNLGFQRGGRRYCKRCQVERTSENRRRRNAAARGDGWERRYWQSEATHCPQNHPYSGENLYVAPSGARGCKTCRREHVRAWAARRRAVREG